MVKKKCSKCKVEKEDSEFYNYVKNKDGKDCQCKKCKIEASQKIAKYKYKNNPDFVKHKIKIAEIARLKRKYNISIEHREELLQKQNHKCAICGKLDTECNQQFAVDHNHITNKIRGLLCVRCNSALGMLNADFGTDLLEKAINYIKENDL